MPWWIAGGIGLLPGLLGLGLGVLALSRAWAVVRARHWPAVQGRVLTSHATAVGVAVRRQTGIGSQRDALRWVPGIEFEYEVGGQLHRSRRIGLTAPSASSERADAEARAARLPAGAAVTVRYDPARPADGVIELGMDPQTISLLVVAATLLLLGACLPFWLAG
jgi:hypothetical protein